MRIFLLITLLISVAVASVPENEDEDDIIEEHEVFADIGMFRYVKMLLVLGRRQSFLYFLPLAPYTY